MARGTLTLVAMAAIGCVTGCGRVQAGRDTSRPGGASSAVAVSKRHAAAIPVGGYLRADGDTDPDDHGGSVSGDDQGEMVTASRHGASRHDRKAVSATTKRYLTAAAAGDAQQVCSLLAPSLAASVAAQGYGTARSASCPAAMALLLRQQHSHLVHEEIATMVVTGVHVDGDVAFTTLGFRKAIESEILLQRENGRWRVNSLFDSALP